MGQVWKTMNKHSIAPKLKKRRHHWNQGLLKGDARLLKTFPFRISASTSSKLRPSICPAVTLMNTSKVTTLGRYPKAKSKQFTFVCLELVNLMGKVVKREKYNAFLKKAQQNYEIMSLRIRGCPSNLRQLLCTWASLRTSKSSYDNLKSRRCGAISTTRK